jgi:hypothetical protein
MSRRTRVAKHPGVYYRLGADGKRRYEISFLDEQGRRRWQVVDGNLELAQAALDERRRRRRNSEPVAPSGCAWRTSLKVGSTVILVSRGRSLRCGSGGRRKQVPS